MTAGTVLLHEQLTEVAVCALDPTDPEYGHFVVTVNLWPGAADLWTVQHYDRYHLNARTGEFDHATCPDDADRAQWMADHYFDYDTAIAHARRVAPTMKCGGYTVDDVRAWRAKAAQVVDRGPVCEACGTCAEHGGCADDDNPVDLTRGDCPDCGACLSCRTCCAAGNGHDKSEAT